ncbi:MAG: preprotein translocase subunit SecG [Catalinimonas sp.]
MSVVLIIMLVLIILLAVLLTLIVLAQNPKGGGLSSTFGGGGSSQMMGVKRTNDLLEKLTWGFAIGIMVLTVSSGFIVNNNDTTSDAPSSVNVERAAGTLPALPQGPDEEAAPLQDIDDADTSNPFGG